MKILTGLFPHMVLQRNTRNQSDSTITGTAEVDGDLVVSATSSGKTLRGWTGKKIGKVTRKRFKADLKGLPSGGPYDLQVSVNKGKNVLEQTVIKDLLVGDVWLVGGQSNMQGCGLLRHKAKPNPMVRAFNMDDKWRVAKDPIHNMWACVDQVHIDLCGGVRPGVNEVTGLGPAVACGQFMEEHTGFPQGLIVSAHGGTSMTQWDPARRDEGGKSLYGAMIRRLRKNGGKAAGMIWYQGESDANASAALLFSDRMKTLIRSVRRDARSPRLPVAMVQISRLAASWADPSSWNSVQDQQRQLQDTVAGVANVPAIDLTLEDLIHVGGEDMNRLGRRLGQAMGALVKSKKSDLLPISLKGIKNEINDRGLVDLIVEFENVVGRLVSGSRPTGFELTDSNRTPFIFDTQLDGSRVILRTTCSTGDLTDKVLHYGFGYNPACNITDEADRSVPVFGPLSPTGHQRALTDFVKSIRVTEPLAGKGDLSSLQRPRKPNSLPWRKLDFDTPFCDMHNELSKHAPEDKLLYFACTLDVPEKMKLAALIGYDGPVKMWIGSKEVYSDPKGINPAVSDQGVVKFDAGKGRHQILVALGTNQCRAWGIYLRFERLDKPRSKSIAPDDIVMPTISPD
jgi:hypothetical protein